MTNVTIPLLSRDDAVPTYAHPSDAGADLRASEELSLGPGEFAAVPTGVKLAIPVGYVGLVHPRSGLAAKHGVTVLNAPGTIDANYRGEVKVLLWNTRQDRSFDVKPGDRIAQLVVQQVVHAAFEQVEELAATDRGDGGFGSTGV